MGSYHPKDHENMYHGNTQAHNAPGKKCRSAMTQRSQDPAGSAGGGRRRTSRAGFPWSPSLGTAAPRCPHRCTAGVAARAVGPAGHTVWQLACAVRKSSGITHTHTCMPTHMHTRTHVPEITHARTHTCTPTHPHPHTCTHTCTHTHIVHTTHTTPHTMQKKCTTELLPPAPRVQKTQL